MTILVLIGMVFVIISEKFQGSHGSILLAYATKDSMTSQKRGSRDFWRIANSVLNKGKFAIPPLFNGPEVLSSASDKAKLFAEKTFLRTPILMTVVSLYVFSF